MPILFFSRSISAALSHLGTDQSSNASSNNSVKGKQHRPGKVRSQLSDSETDGSCSDVDTQNNRPSQLERFLAAFKLEEHYSM